MRFAVVLGLLLAAFVQTANAADLGGNGRFSFKDESSYGEQFSWTGAYVGGQIGYARAFTEADVGPLSGFNQSFDYDGDGFIGGFHGGYNFQSGNFVYGIETDIDFADLDETAVGSLGTVSHQTEINWLGSLRGRLGWAMDKTLFYVTAGLAYGEVDITQNNLVGAPLTVTTSEIRYGYTVGGGVERAFTNNLTARLEYSFTDLGVTEVRDEVLGQLERSDVTVHAIRAGISYKF